MLVHQHIAYHISLVELSFEVLLTCALLPEQPVSACDPQVSKIMLVVAASLHAAGRKHVGKEVSGVLQQHIPITGIHLREVILERQGITQFRHKYFQETLLFLHL